MSFGDPRAWAGVSLLVASGIAISKRVRGWQGILAWWILFLPAANLFFPIGTLMGERLAFLPSAGLAAFVAAGMASMGRRTLTVVLVVIAAAFSTVSAVRYRTCSTPQRFYEGLVRDAPENAKAWSSLGLWLASENRLGEAVTAYDRSIELYPFDGAARFNRANALVRLGRLDEAAAEYRNVVRLNPGRTRAESILRKLGYR